MSLQNQMSKRISRTTKANTDSQSIRATIPKQIADELDLGADENIEWDTYTEKGQKYARFRKLV